MTETGVELEIMHRLDLLPVGSELDEKYEILKVLGTGANGVVYQGQHLILGDLAAIKVLKAERVNDGVSLARFKREAQLACQLEHPNLVQVKSFGVSAEGLPYLVMDFVEGKPLSEYLKENRVLALPTFKKIFLQILDALAYAHSKGIIHRDIKPSNILLTDSGEARLIDLGLAKIFDDEIRTTETITKTGAIAGTPTYMSPEQCTGAQLTPASDIYSLAAVMFESIVGRPPFTGGTELLIMRSHVNDTAEFPANLSIPPELESLVIKSLSKDPADRYESAQSMADLLAQTNLESAAVKRILPVKNVLLLTTASILVFCLLGLCLPFFKPAPETVFEKQQFKRNDLRPVNVRDDRSYSRLMDSIDEEQKLAGHRDNDEQIQYSKKLANHAISAAEKEGDFDHIVIARLRLVEVARDEQEQAIKRLRYLENFLEEHPSVPVPRQVRVYFALGENLLKHDEWEAGLRYLKKAFSLAEPGSYDRINCLRWIAKCNLHFDQVEELKTTIRQFSKDPRGDGSDYELEARTFLGEYYIKHKLWPELDLLLKDLRKIVASAEDPTVSAQLVALSNLCEDADQTALSQEALRLSKLAQTNLKRRKPFTIGHEDLRERTEKFVSDTH